MHRGSDPEDERAFDSAAWPALRAGVADLSWLLSRGYAPSSALKLVGDRWSLTARQRMAVLRSSCSNAARDRRRRHEIGIDALRGQPLWIDGFNLLTTIEAALGGAVVLRGRDGVDRNLAGVHGTYRKVEETLPALNLVGRGLAELAIGPVAWLLDRPVSNSGRLKAMILERSADEGWSWSVALEFNPDATLSASAEVVATADSVILDRCERWFNLAHILITKHITNAHVVELCPEPAGTGTESSKL